MFISANERKGSCYFEFQFCKINRPLKSNKVKTDIVEYWKKDSLLISDEDFDEFYNLYGEIFECAVFPNGETGFYPYGINYYTNENTLKIFNKLKHIDKKYIRLLSWLEEAAEKYNGFYILGIQLRIFII